MRLKSKLLFVAAGIALVLLGRWSVGGGGAVPAGGSPSVSEASEVASGPTLWTCPMHPQIKLPDPGKCPICGMELVPLHAGMDDQPRRLAMSPAARELAGIETTPVVRKNVTRPVRMVGKIDYDETVVRTISAWVAGRLDRLFVDYTGVRVHRGDHLVWLYSPALLTAQEELLSARERQSATAGEESRFLERSNQRSYEAAREKLVLWGLTEEQVDEIERRGSAEDHVMLTSPTSGVVIEKLLDEGAYVQTGTHIYKIADLSRLWVRLDAYEQDLAWLRHGQTVAFEVEALPGEAFEGTISYIDPIIHEKTRSAKVRVNVQNEDGRLKPGMFVRAVTSVGLGPGGVVLDRALAGKWVSPMHPEIVKDEPGSCDVCGMALVRAEDLGLVSGRVPTNQRPLVVPRSAVLVTGTRAVVYVDVPGVERPTFEGREIVLGPRAGDEYIVFSGLEEGERVVVNGAFRIDSSMQIQAKPSMMSMSGRGVGLQGPVAREFRASLRPIYDGYLALQGALAADDLERARSAAAELLPTIDEPVAAGLPSAYRTRWREDRESLRTALERSAQAESLADLRARFAELSATLLTVVEELGYEGPLLSEVYCPMALGDVGASWLQLGDAVSNPFLDASMRDCGEVRQTFGDPRGAPGAAGAEHEHHGAGQERPGPDEASGGDGADRQASRTGLSRVLDAYLRVHASLAADDGEGARDAFDRLLGAVLQAARRGVDPRVEAQLHRLHRALLEIEEQAGIERLREVFREVSDPLIAIGDEVGNPTDSELHVVHCPMALDSSGADWLQASETVENPYFGRSMHECGSVSRTWGVD